MAESVGKFFVRNNTRIKNIIVSSKIELIKNIRDAYFKDITFIKKKINRINIIY